MQSLLKIAVISTVLLLVEGSLFRSSADEKSLASSSTITQENLSSILDRLETLEQKLDEQQRQIEELEKSSASSRSLQDDECGWSFVNDNGTPSCKVNYQVAADHGLNVRGSATFKGRTNFEDNVDFKDDVEFHDEVEFYDDVLFGTRADVKFLDTVTFKDDVKIDGPGGRRKIRFRIQDNVQVEFKPRYDIDFETKVNFYKDVHIQAKECRDSGKGYGRGCSSDDDDHPPELFVEGGATFESDVTIDNDLHVDTILPDHASEVSIPTLLAARLSSTTISTFSLNAHTINAGTLSSGSISVTGAISAASLAVSNTITAAGNIESTSGSILARTINAGTVSASSLSVTGAISAASLAVSNTISAAGNIESTSGSILAAINVEADQNVTAGANVIAGGTTLTRRTRGLQSGSGGRFIGSSVQVDDINGVLTSDIASTVSTAMAAPADADCSCTPDLTSLVDQYLTIAGLNVTGAIDATSLNVGNGAIVAGSVQSESYTGISFPALNATEILAILENEPSVKMMNLEVEGDITAATVSASGYSGLPTLTVESGSPSAATFNGTQILEFLQDQNVIVKTMTAETYIGLDDVVEEGSSSALNETELMDFLKTQTIVAAGLDVGQGSINAESISAATSLTVDGQNVLTDATPVTPTTPNECICNADVLAGQVISVAGLNVNGNVDVVGNVTIEGAMDDIGMEIPFSGGYLSAAKEISAGDYEGLPPVTSGEVLDLLETANIVAQSLSVTDITAGSIMIGDDAVIPGGGGEGGECGCEGDIFAGQTITVGGIIASGDITMTAGTLSAPVIEATASMSVAGAAVSTSNGNNNPNAPEDPVA